MSMYVTKNKLLAEGVTKAPSTMLKGFSNQYDKIVESGIRRNPIPKVLKKGRGRPRKGTARSLVDRLQKLKADVMRFFTDFKVPYSNKIGRASCRERV